MAPDAIPVRPRASVATLPPEAIQALFGASTTLRSSTQVALVRLGEVRAYVAVRPGAALTLEVDALDASSLGSASGLRLQGPVGAFEAPTPQAVQSVLRIPKGLKAAWRMGDTATIGLGPLATQVAVETGDALALHAEQALWLAAGSPATARWLPQTTWALEPDPEPVSDPRIATIARRVVTETDVRQARLRHQRIQLAPGQIVTPSARSLAREWNLFTELATLPEDRPRA